MDSRSKWRFCEILQTAMVCPGSIIHYCCHRNDVTTFIDVVYFQSGSSSLHKCKWVTLDVTDSVGVKKRTQSATQSLLFNCTESVKNYGKLVFDMKHVFKFFVRIIFHSIKYLANYSGVMLETWAETHVRLPFKTPSTLRLQSRQTFVYKLY
jgi:hypothetical protein